MSEGFRPLIKTLLLAFLIFPAAARSQQTENLVILEHADSLVGLEVNGEKARQLLGHVRLRQGHTTATCNRAVQFLSSNKVTMEGEVEVREDSLRLVSSRGVYYGDSKIAEVFDRVLLEDGKTTLRSQYGKYFTSEKKAFFRENVSVEDTASFLTSEEFTYYRADQRSIATGHVRITSTRNGLTITGGKFEDFKQRHYSRITESPAVTQVDTSQGTRDTLTVTSVMMESFSDSLEKLIATEHVQITRDGLAAVAGNAVFFTAIDSIILRKSPVIWYSEGKYDEHQVAGDSIFLKLVRRKLQTAYVLGHPFAISRADSAYPNRFNQMTGQEIILHFSENKMRRIDVNRTATSLYFLFDGRKGNGANRTTGDRVTINFLDGKLDKIVAAAGVEGKYFPEKMIRGKEGRYNLEGFKYRTDRPGSKK